MRAAGTVTSLIAALGVGMIPVAGLAQTDEDRAAPEAEILDELVITARPDDQRETKAQYQERLRQQLLEEARRASEIEAEQAWRRDISPTEDADKPRITWGYDPNRELEMRDQLDLDALPGDTTKPATLFRAEF